MTLSPDDARFLEALKSSFAGPEEKHATIQRLLRIVDELRQQADAQASLVEGLREENEKVGVCVKCGGQFTARRDRTTDKCPYCMSNRLTVERDQLIQSLDGYRLSSKQAWKAVDDLKSKLADAEARIKEMEAMP